ncbi:uncharacterized protein CcaverHIS019_0207960 [Cutaneotrichosporon cavernicola]|uniref:Uncharacterized protein n=1 Tax=Cutaneotrichosporon cavernicola TaxID=279322 RepID=A0AA48KYI4_9TREE|nr:uncharacterized protein CcaverHIS019_0207960 [Cutaneotrichosporon cavernicola]BEI89434.1 hypothetical protein CcaverHIS019_0207960 [Cutaneotrichosporon cavernicola]BEJ04982.1 hypothetical protein CcaverHIS641_0207990 [Cutaneotrichosporon cavernicola]
MSSSSTSSSSSESSSSYASSSSSASESTPSPSRPRATKDELLVPDEDEGENEVYAPSPTLLAAYDTLMTSRFPGISLPSSISTPAPGPVTVLSDDEEEDPNRPLTKAERQNAKKKRRKERERALKAAAAAAKGETLPTPTQKNAEEGPISFRLFRPLVSISLSTVESYELTSNPRVRPLPLDVQDRIHRLAAEAAIDAPTFPSLPTQLEEWRAEMPTPPVFLAYTNEEEHKCVAVPACPPRLADASDISPISACPRRPEASYSRRSDGCSYTWIVARA